MTMDHLRPLRRRARARLLSRVALAALALGVAAPALALETMPLAEVRPGLRGEVHTVIQGAEQEVLELEVLGVLDDGIGPGIPMILARFVDERGQWTGVAAGMSGSPVLIDGRLVGALSYSIGSFSKEPICGITPIERMLELEELPGGLLPWLGARSADTRPFPLALVTRGIGPAAHPVIEEAFSELGLPAPVQIAPAARGGVEAEGRLQAGDPVAALLVWGDITLGATGTITWREGDELLAFGHPFLGYGRISVPLAPAEVIWTVPSLFNSFKIARIGEPVGAVRQDRLTAIRGEVGAAVEGLEMAVTLRRPGQAEVRRQFFLARDPFITPLLADITLATLLVQDIGAERDEAVRMTAAIALDGGRTIRFDAAAAAGGQSRDLTVALNRRLTALLQAPVPVPDIGRLEVTLEAVPEAGRWEIRRVMPDRLQVEPGERLRAFVDLEGPRGRERREVVELEVPADALAGRYALLVGSARQLDGEFGSLAEARRRTARTPEAYLEAVADSSSDSRLEARLALPAEGIVTEGGEYPALPGSAHILLRSRPGGGELYRARWLPIASAGTDLERGIEGVGRVAVTVRSPGDA
jgi:hypothetical protein